MKMSGLCWMAVMLTFLLSAGNSFAAVDKKKLANIVKFIIDRYEIKSQVSVAVNIPQENADPQEIFEKATTDAVKRKLSSNQVYPGDNSDTKVVVAKPNFNISADPDSPYSGHAEALVLENIKPLVQDSNGKVLVFYSFYSPCIKCTSTGKTITGKINEVFPKWNSYAFVFSKVYDRNGTITKDVTKESLKQLGNSKIGQNNIFRCYKPINKAFQCINCFNNRNVVQQCVDNKA